MNEAIYDQLGEGYAHLRKTDSRIARQIWQHLIGATRLINIGAGSGSYEPEDIDLVAVEPSIKMIKQRAPDAPPAILASAELLPFKDNTFSHALTILSMHHWSDRPAAFEEINRVATERFTAVTWKPEAQPFWLTQDYFPEIYETDRMIFPKLEELQEHFDDVQIHPLMIPADCQDGFLAAYWKRPEAYLDPEVRQSISTFSKLKDVKRGLKKLEEDLRSGRWHQLNSRSLAKL